MSISAFGVDHGEISKRGDKPNFGSKAYFRQDPDATKFGRALGTIAETKHGKIATTATGGAIGTAVGLRYAKKKQAQALSKSVFGVDHGEISKGRLWNAVKSDMDLNKRPGRSLKPKKTSDWAKMSRKSEVAAVIRDRKKP